MFEKYNIFFGIFTVFAVEEVRDEKDFRDYLRNRTKEIRANYSNGVRRPFFSNNFGLDKIKIQNSTKKQVLRQK